MTKRPAILTSMLTCLAASGCSAWAAPELEAHHPQVTQMVVKLMEYQHYAPKAVDDAFSEAWLDDYLMALDPTQMVFVQADIDEFQRYRHQLDDMSQRSTPELAPALAIYSRYQTRLKERTDAIHQILAQPIDMTTDERWTYDPDNMSWPADAAAANEAWRKRVTNDMIISTLQAERNVGRSYDEIVETIRKRYDRKLSDELASDSTDALEKYLSAFTRAFDPHSVYLRPMTSDNFDIDISHSLEGIGARLQVDGDYTVVDSIVPGGPADLDGDLQPGDRIVGVAQGSSLSEDVIGMRLDRVVSLIRGRKGTEVRLTVIPVDAQSGTRVVTIMRDKVLLSESDAEGSVIERDGQRYGVIDVPSFYIDKNRPLPGGGYYGASADVRRILGELEAQEIDGLVLDFRGNGGGSLSEALSMTGLFIRSGPVVQIRDRMGGVEVLDDPDPSLVYDGPMVVLTDQLSASASEIVAGALQDYGRALVVGSEKTHGKGTVQQLLDLDAVLAQYAGISARSGALKFTFQKFYRVSGGSTQNEGVRADIVLPSYWDGLDIFESDLDNAMAYDEIDAVRYRQVGDLSSSITSLRDRSAARVAQNENFQSLMADLAEREKNASDNTLSLNLDVRRLESMPAASEEEEESAEAVPADDHSGDFILQEATHILEDWRSM
jgi:carboxyl-terminal processing protease